MGFLLYRKTPVGEVVCYEKLKPLKFGGRDGLIAQHVKTLSDAETQKWKLDTASLLKLAGHESKNSELTVLFDVAAVTQPMSALRAGEDPRQLSRHLHTAGAGFHRCYGPGGGRGRGDGGFTI